MVIGHGHMGRLHATKLAQRSDLRVSVVDPGQGLAWPTGAQVDCAVVATPSRTHHAVALPLLQAGIPCLVEKPLAIDLEQARALAQFDHLSVGHIERFNPALDPVRQVRPRFVVAERLAPWRGGSAKPGARGTDADVVADLMVHDLDLALYFLGDRLRDLRAVGVGVQGTDPDICNARLELGDGVAQLTASRVSRTVVRTLRLVEDGVYWSVDLHKRRVTQVRWGQGALEGEPVPVPPGDSLERQHAAFLSAVRTEAPMPVSGAAGVRALELAAAVRSGVDGGRPPDGASA